MPLAEKTETHRLGGLDYRLTSLVDGDQFDDPRGLARAAGIPDAYWSLFGRLWPSGLHLAQHCATTPLDPVSTLEIGCGLALPGLVLRRRGGEVTVSDAHPFARGFLRRNARLNGVTGLVFRTFDWTRAPPRLGRFGHILASDVCYLPGHADELVRFVAAHGAPDVHLTLADPGRPDGNRLVRLLADAGFDVVEVVRDRPGRRRITRLARR